MRTGDLLALPAWSTATRRRAYHPRRPGVGSRLQPQHPKPLRVGIVAPVTRKGETKRACMMCSRDDMFVVDGSVVVPGPAEPLPSTVDDA